MSTALKQGEPALRGVRRILAEHIDRSIRLLRRRSLTDATVHEIRKEMKRIRAGLRLLRGALGETAYGRLNRSVRDAARPLTPIRDAKVLRDALDDVLQHADKSVPKDLAGKLVRALRQAHRSSREQLTNKVLSAIRGRLQKLKRHLHGLSDAQLDRAPIHATFKRVYKNARKAFALAKQDPSNEHLHEWRKQVKYYFLQLELIQPLAPKRIGATIKQAHKLTDHLGDDHDLALLHEKIAAHATQPQGSADTAEGAALIEKLKRRRAKLQRKAYRMGDALCVDPPKQVAKRIERYADAWRKPAT